MLRFTAENQRSKLRPQLELLLRSLRPGTKLPSEPVLAQKYGVSRSTVRDVMGQLAAEGFVTRRQGSGTFVNAPPLVPQENLIHFVDFPTLIAKEGYCPSSQQLGFILQPAGTFFSRNFGIDPTDRVITRRCLYLADGCFAVLAEDSFPLNLITTGQYNQLLRSENTDLRLFLFNATGRTTYRDETTLSVVTPADYPYLAELLGGEELPLLFINSVCLDKENRPFTCAQIYSNTNYIKYKLNRHML